MLLLLKTSGKIFLKNNDKNIKDEFVRDWTKEEMEENRKKLANFQSGVTTEKTPEKKRRSGVN